MRDVNFLRVFGVLLGGLIFGFILMKIAAIDLKLLWAVFIVLILGMGIRIVFLWQKGKP